MRSDLLETHRTMLDAMQSATLGDDSRDGDARCRSSRRSPAGKRQGKRHVCQATRSNPFRLAHSDRGGELLARNLAILTAELAESTNRGEFRPGLPANAERWNSTHARAIPRDKPTQARVVG